MNDDIDDVYNYIEEKIKDFKKNNIIFKDKPDYFCFTALCLKSNFYKNPSYKLTDDDLLDLIVDGSNDKGVDAILNDPNSDDSDLILIQSKYYNTIQFDDIKSAFLKMFEFEKEMNNGAYTQSNSANLYSVKKSNMSENAKTKFVFYTSARRSGIRSDKFKKLLNDNFPTNNLDNYEIECLFGDDIKKEIEEFNCRRPNVESGELKLDESNNFLSYNDDAVLVNISAYSLKELYTKHRINLLSQNLRYYVKKKDVDDGINRTIKENPNGFWFKNNGITIICDDFEIDSKILKLKNFSIINGGQTTYLISNSQYVSKENDFYLTCKVVKSDGNNEDEKNQFSLEIAQATNSQKAIKKNDLLSNKPEQIVFSQELKNIGVYYKTKNGEKIPSVFKEDNKNTDLKEVGKLYLCGIFQRPGTSRNKPSTMYDEKYYNKIFFDYCNKNRKYIATLIKQYLYVDDYFNKKFLKKYKKEFEACNIVTLANNSRTLCLSFAALVARYFHHNISDEQIYSLDNYKDKYDDHLYEIFSNIDREEYVWKENVNLDDLDSCLYNLFKIIIDYSYDMFTDARDNQQDLNETNFLKKDENYYKIISRKWNRLKNDIKDFYEIFQ